jgi:hypothetical protein
LFQLSIERFTIGLRHGRPERGRTWAGAHTRHRVPDWAEERFPLYAYYPSRHLPRRRYGRSWILLWRASRRNGFAPIGNGWMRHNVRAFRTSLRDLKTAAATKQRSQPIYHLRIGRRRIIESCPVQSADRHAPCASTVLTPSAMC